MTTTKKRPRARSHAARKAGRTTGVARATAGTRRRAADDPKHTPIHPGLRKGCQAWYHGIGRGWEGARWRVREQIGEAGAALAEFLQKADGYVPPVYVAHITKVARSTLSRAASRGDIRSVRYTLPSGHRIVLVNLADALKLG